MINLIFLIVSVFSNNVISNDLNIIENEYKNLLFLYHHPFLIKDDIKLIKKLENKTYIDKKSEPIHIKLLSELYFQNKKNQNLKNLRKKYNIVTDFNYLKIKNIKLFYKLPIEYIKKKYIDTSKNLSLNHYYILETYCKFKDNHSIYFYNDLTNKIYFNNKLFTGNKFIISKNKNKIFKVSLKVDFSKKTEGLIYLKGANCSKEFISDKLNSRLKVKVIPRKLIAKNSNSFNYNFNYDKEDIEELSEEKTPFSYYKLYNYYLSSNMENKAYNFLKLWRKNCNNYYSRKEFNDFVQKYISHEASDLAFSEEVKKPITLEVTHKPVNITVNSPFALTKNKLPEQITKNEVLHKDIFIKKINDEYFQYTHYLIAIKNAGKFIEYFKVPSDVDLLGVYSIENNKKIPLATKFTENEIFLKEIKNNMFLEIFVKSIVKDVIFLPERYLSVKNLSIKFDKNINYKLINLPINKKEFLNLKPYFETPLEANLLDFMPYFIINDIPKEINTLKWYYFYKSLSDIEIPDEIKKINDIKKLYSLKEENKALLFYRWGEFKEIGLKLLIFHLKNDIYGDKLFNYPIIAYKDLYLDLNLENLGFGKLPLYLKNKEYIEIDDKGRYLYKGKEKILKNFVRNNKVKIDYKILNNLDFAEFEINIEIYDNYRSGIKNLLNKYKDEEVIAQILEIYINTKFKNSSLIDYEIINKNPVQIYIKGIIKNPLDYFEINNSELLKIKNHFSELFTPFFNQSPLLIEYILNDKIINPIEIRNSYQEDLELNIELKDKNYALGESNKIQIKTSFYLPKSIITPENYGIFYKKLKNYINFRKNLLNNINIKKVIQ